MRGWLMRTGREPIVDGDRQDRRADRDAHDDGQCDALREQEGRRGQGERRLRTTEGEVRTFVYRTALLAPP